MRTICIANQKGGSCKTTSAVNLAAAFGRSRRVLLIDLDPQANASRWLGTKDGGTGLREALTEGRPLSELTVPTAAEGVDLIPSSPWLRTAEKLLAGEPGAETIFRRAVEKLPKRWDVIVVDCSPWLGLLTISAMTACREIVVPVEASSMAEEGLAQLMPTIEKVREALNPKLRTTAIVPSRVDERCREDLRIVDELRSHFPRLVTKLVIHASTRVKEASSRQQPLEQFAPSSRAAEEFRSLAAELSRRN
jgi:chromosome partitioning protein